jgi:hypothetical protein
MAMRVGETQLGKIGLQRGDFFAVRARMSRPWLLGAWVRTP